MDDMIAELTLRINNQMNEGLDAIRAEMGGIEDGAAGVRTAMLEMTAAMNDMPSGMGIEAALTAVITEANSARDAVLAIGAAAESDITQIGDLKAAMADMSFHNTFMPPAADDGRPAMMPPGVQLPPEQPPPDEEGGGGGDGGDNEGRFRRGKGNGNADLGFLEWIIGPLALLSGWDGEKSYAEFQGTAMQAAQIEGFDGPQRLAEAQRIMHESYNQAYLSRGNVDEIEQAYFNLIRNELPKSLVDQVMGPLSEASTTYDTPMDQITSPVLMLTDMFKIPGDQMTQALGILGQATHLGHYYFSDFGQGLPQVSMQFGRMGDTGLKGESDAAAALETVRFGTPDSASDATDLSYLMTYMTSGIASRFFDRTQRSQDLLGAPIMALFDKYHIKPLDLPKFFDAEQAKGVDPLDAMVDYMHTMDVKDKMSPTDASFVFTNLFHSQEASTAMMALLNNYDMFQHDKSVLENVNPDFLDKNFQSAITGDQAGVSQYDLLGTYLSRLWGQNTFGLFMGPGDTNSSQSTLGAISPGSNAFNIPITLNVNVDKSGNVTAYAEPGVSASVNGQQAPTPGVNLRIHQGQVLGAP